MVPSTKKHPLHTIHQWMSTFQIFVSIYAERVPQDTPALMKYGSIVKELATLGANWKFYDENLRKLRESQGVPWNQVHSELWLRSHSFRAKPNTQQRKSKIDGPFIPKGYCWKFHRSPHCPGCSFKHQCFRCGQSHCDLCDTDYIGYTTRYLHQRIEEYRASAVGTHVKACHGTSNPELLKQFSVLKKCQGKLDCLIREMLFNRERNPKLNTQSDSIRAKVFV